jgi:predicted permease
MAGLLLDLRHAVRLYWKTPWQSLLAVLMLAAAMALVSTTAGLWSELNLAGTPGVTDDRGLMTIGSRSDRPMGVLSASGISDLAQRSQTLQSVTGVSIMGALSNIDLDGKPIEGLAGPVLPGFFQTLRPRLALGRGLADSDFSDDGARVLVLSHWFWERHFDGDPDVLGREFEMADQRWRVVGVTDPAFRDSTAVVFWLPFRRYLADLQEGWPPQMAENFPFFRVFARRAGGVELAAVEDELRRLVTDLPAPAVGQPITPEQVLALEGLIASPEAHRSAQRQTHLLLAAAALVAAVAAVNTGIFLLARAPTRRRELALRHALGAGRRRLTGQLVIEAAVLVVPATVIGLVVSLWLGVLFRELALFSELRLDRAWLNLPALAFSSLLAGALTVLVALVPISLIRGRRLSEQARQTSSRPGPLQYAAGLIQLSLAGLVGATAIGFVVHVWLLEGRDIGLDADGVVVATIGLQRTPDGTASLSFPEANVVAAFRSEIREYAAALPGVGTVSFGSPLPGQRMVAMSSHEIDGRQINARRVTVAPGFIDVLGIDLLHGRDFEDDSEPGVIITRRFAEAAWGETDVIGRFISPSASTDERRGRVIGVVDDVLYQHPDRPPEPIALSTGAGVANFLAAIVIRGNPDPELLTDRVDEALEGMMDGLYVQDVRPLAELIGELTALDRARAGVTALFGLTIVVMAAFGFFALQRFLVDSGRRETAIHMALGAGPRRIRRQVLTRALVLGTPGLVIGSLSGLIAIAWLTGDLISERIPPLAIAGLTSVSLLGLMIAASLHPALRAAATRPGAMLRED